MMTKKNVMPIVVLTAICVVVAALLGLINVLTEERIAQNEAQKVYDSFRVVLDGTFETLDVPEDAPKSVTSLYKVTDGDTLKGHVLTLVTKGYAGDISITVGVDKDGKVTKAVVTSEAESHGKAGMKNYTDNFAGVGPDEVEGVDTFTGATASSTAIKNAIVDAVKFMAGIETVETLPKTDEEIIALGKQLIGSEVELTDVTPADADIVKRMYKASGNAGYIAYTLVISQYGTTETETLIHISNTGKIVSTNKLVWKTSDAMYGYVPPTDDVVNEFYGRLPGITSGTADGVELVTNATNTSTNLMKGVKEALAIADNLIKQDMPTPEADIIAAAKELIGADVTLEDMTPDERNYLKKIYKAGENKGYIAYAVVISANYGTVETETLIHISTTGKIVGVKKMVWKTSDAMYGYVPPTEDVVDAFYASLSGNSSATVDGVELVTNATNTSTNLMNAIKESLAASEALIKKDMPTPEDQIISLGKELIGTDVELADVTPEGLDFVKKIYKAGAGKGYIAYAVVISANYGTVETETLIHIGSNGKIEGVKKMIWKTSDAMYGYVPPTEDVVDAFYASLAGNSSATVDGVELVTNATNTSTNLMNAIKEALGATDALIAKDLPTAEADIIAAAKEMIGKDVELVDITPASADYLKRLYKSSEGYIAYTVVISQYGTVETETLIYIDNDGKIESVKKMIWKTSDAMYGYVPPTEEVVNAFYAKLPGNSAGTIEGVELVTNATNTSTNLVNAIKEALTALDAEIALDKANNNTARIVGIAVIAVAIAAVTAVTVIKRKRRAV